MIWYGDVIFLSKIDESYSFNLFVSKDDSSKEIPSLLISKSLAIINPIPSHLAKLWLLSCPEVHPLSNKGFTYLDSLFHEYNTLCTHTRTHLSITFMSHETFTAIIIATRLFSTLHQNPTWSQAISIYICQAILILTI